MRSLLPVALLLGLILPVAPAAAQRPVELGRHAERDGAVRIHNLVGSVRVVGWDRDSIAVRGTVAGRTDELTLHVSGGNAKLGIWSGAGSPPAAHLEVHVPRASRVWVKTESAPVGVEGVTGGLDLATVSGGIEVRGSPRELFAESMAGAIELEIDARVLRARTAGADITLRGRVADAEVVSVSGTVRVLNKQVERGRFESVEGRVWYTGGVAPRSVAEFITHSGDIVIELPRDVNADLLVSSFQGGVESRLGGSLVQRGGRRDYALVLGAGGAELIVRTFKGEVRLGYR